MASNPAPLLLASTSRYRRHLLQRLGVPFVSEAPQYEEEHGLDRPPDKLVLHFARAKAESLAQDFPQHIIIGADQIPVLNGTILKKPGTPEAARDQLARLQGRTHRLLTGLAVASPNRETVSRLQIHEMTMRQLTEREIAAYVERDRPLDCAGSYKIEEAGIALFETVKGDDYTGIIGLPLTKLATVLRELGVDIF